MAELLLEQLPDIDAAGKREVPQILEQLEENQRAARGAARRLTSITRSCLAE